MIIEIHRLSKEGSSFVGADPVSVLELENDHLIRATEPVRYDLFAEVVGSELIVRGQVEVDVELMCSKCGEFFSTTVQVSSFLRAYEITPDLESVDLGPDIREDILLAIPNYPACGLFGKGANPRCEELQKKGYTIDPPMEENRWSGLDALDSSSGSQ